MVRMALSKGDRKTSDLLSSKSAYEITRGLEAADRKAVSDRLDSLPEPHIMKRESAGLLLYDTLPHEPNVGLLMSL